MPADVPIQDVLSTVFQSIFEVFLLCLAGFTLSLKGIVDKPASKVLNHINVAIFTPALLFSKVAFFLTPAKIRQLWVIPILFTVVTGLSAVVAHWLARAFRLKRSQVNFATAASMFMNSNSLPVALMQSLVTTVPLLKWGPDDTIDAMFGRSLTYLVVFSTLGMILRWSYGIHLISQADEPEPTAPAPTIYRDADDTDGHPALAHITVDQLVHYEAESDIEPHDRTTHARRRLHTYSHLPAVPTSLGDQSESDDSDEVGTTEGDSEETIVLPSEPIDTESPTVVDNPMPTPAFLPSSSSSQRNVSPPRWARQTGSTPLSLFTRLLSILTSLSPPLVASLLAIFCVLAPPVQRLLKSELMIPVKGALDNAGGCSIPLTMVVLGGWFWDGQTNNKSKGKRVARGGSDGQDHSKSNGKGVGKHHSPGSETGTDPTLLGEQQGNSHTLTAENVLSRLQRHEPSPSRDSSATSLSSMIGAFGDVFMTRVYPRGGSRRTQPLTRGNVGASEGDVEQGPLGAHTWAQNENAEHEIGRSSPPQAQTDPVNGHAQPSPTSLSLSPSSPTSHLHPSTWPPPRGTNPPGETLTVIITLVARMVIVPLIVTPVMVLVSRLGWGGEIYEDPVFIVSSMLLVASPPALTLAQISQRAKVTADGGADTEADAISPFERLLSRTVFWAYLVLTPPITMASVLVGLLLIDA